MSKALKSENIKKSQKTLELVGCSPEQLKKHLEVQFTEDMSWNNHGEWHIDHIIPVTSFDFTIKEEQEKCFYYTNLQPLWATTEVAKKHGSNKIGNINKGVSI